MTPAPCTDCPSLGDCIRHRAEACDELLGWRAGLDRSVPEPHTPATKADRKALDAALVEMRWADHRGQPGDADAA